MVVRNFADVIVALAVLVLPIITGYIAKAMGKSSALSGLISVLPMVAKDAVVVAEKTGVLNSLTGNEQFAKALSTAQEALDKLGYDKVDEQVLGNAIEQAYAQLKSSGALAVYKKPVEPKPEVEAQPKPEAEAEPKVEAPAK